MVEQHGIPESMARRLTVLGDEAVVESAIKSYRENGFYQDSGGGRWENDSPERPIEVINESDVDDLPTDVR